MQQVVHIGHYDCGSRNDPHPGTTDTYHTRYGRTSAGRRRSKLSHTPVNGGVGLKYNPPAMAHAIGARQSLANSSCTGS